MILTYQLYRLLYVIGHLEWQRSEWAKRIQAIGGDDDPLDILRLSLELLPK